MSIFTDDSGVKAITRLLGGKTSKPRRRRRKSTSTRSAYNAGIRKGKSLSRRRTYSSRRKRY